MENKFIELHLLGYLNTDNGKDVLYGGAQPTNTIINCSDIHEVKQCEQYTYVEHGIADSWLYIIAREDYDKIRTILLNI